MEQLSVMMEQQISKNRIEFVGKINRNLPHKEVPVNKLFIFLEYFVRK
jgi:hypothetical protein